MNFFYLNLFRIGCKYFIIILSFFSYSLGEIKLVYSNKILSFNIEKLVNPIQRYPHIIESYACIVEMFLLPMNFFTSFGKCSALNLSKYAELLDASSLSPFTHEAIQ